ncbi:FAD-binding protein [Entomomonas moraniae]|uniref:D-lactate dehydrogenase (cytochrome) n=1 Tax=Entomomonas moraniae TaxID=2213226 RepID=A0A3S9XFU0_9GAMM|nr:FAD-linked oxidase C-terminal domain-containing protein [Entomomonas moraniae]AZS51156.1 FAD-binding protein [Entomomonas moraniae]
MNTCTRRPVSNIFLDALTSALGDRVSTALAVREHHGRDESMYATCPPDAVVFARSTDDVVTVVKLCNEHDVPVIAFGAGSSIEGHVLPFSGGVTIDLSEMNHIVAVNPEDLTATVQAGVTRKQLNHETRNMGLFFPIDPGADATIGGMAATRASGTNAVRYGTMRDNVVSLTVVTAEGKVIRTSSRAKKSSAGYDLTAIFVGSEGTLGIITEVTVKLHVQPEGISAAICSFPTVQDAVQCVIATIQMGIPVARVEIMDTAAVKAVNQYSHLDLKESPVLLFEFHGTPDGVTEQSSMVQEIAKETGGQDFNWATQTEDRNKLWTARHNAFFASMQLKPGCRGVSTDVCVPISRLAESIDVTIDELAKSSIAYTIVGHVGDGNYHVILLIDPKNAEEVAEMERINHGIVQRAIAMDGTCTGEHGVGVHKIPFLVEEHGENALDMMRALKRAFDPKNILNPGKIVSLN